MINLNKNCKASLIKKLAKALETPEVHFNSILFRNSLNEVFSIDKTIPQTGTQRDLLVEYISEEPLVDFIHGFLSKEIYEELESSSKSPTSRKLKELDKYNDLNALSQRLIETLDNLPWNYCFTFKLNSEISPYFAEKITQVAPNINIIKTGNELSTFPLESGIKKRDERIHKLGLIGLRKPHITWEKNHTYIQIFVEGFVGVWATSTATKALDSFRSILGLMIAMGILEVKPSLLPENTRSRYYIHKKENSWEIDNSDDLSNDISQTIDDLRIDDHNGLLDDEMKKSIFVTHSVKQIYDALSHEEASKKIVLAGQWFFDSCCGQNELLSYIQAIVAFEILLGRKAATDEAGLKVILANRCAYLIAVTEIQREEILSDVEAIYQIRNHIVHRGKNKLKNSELLLLNKLKWMISRVIKEEIKLVSKN